MKTKDLKTNTIFIVGLPGVGKTAIGKKLASLLSSQCLDTDQLIETQTNQKVFDIITQNGELHFRNLEKIVLDDILSCAKNSVISCGGGFPAFFDNIKRMKEFGIVVHVKCDFAIIASRIKLDEGRPLINYQNVYNSLQSLWKSRKFIYEDNHIEIDNSYLEIDKTIEELVTKKLPYFLFDTV